MEKGDERMGRRHGKASSASECFELKGGWRVRLGVGELQCFNERSGQTFVDDFQYNWSLTRLYLFQELGAFFERMLRFAERPRAGRWTGEVAWAIAEVRPGVFRASWARHRQHVVWCEDRPRTLFWRYRESRLHALVLLAREVAEVLYVARPGPGLPDARVARGRFHDWWRSEDYSFPRVRGWARVHRGTRRLHAPARRCWLASDPLCPCFVGCHQRAPPGAGADAGADTDGDGDGRITGSTSSNNHADLIWELDMSELAEVTVRRVAPSRLVHVLFPDGCCFCGRAEEDTPRCEFVLRFSPDPGGSASEEGAASVSAAAVVITVDGAEDIAMWRRALERCLWVNRSTKKLRALQRRQHQNNQQQGSSVLFQQYLLMLSQQQQQPSQQQPSSSHHPLPHP